MAAVVELRKPQPQVRKFHCCQCGRYLTETTAKEGMIRAKCEPCRKWWKFDILTMRPM